MTAHRVSTIRQAGCATITACTLAVAQILNPATPVPPDTPSTGRVGAVPMQLASLSTFLTTSAAIWQKKPAAQLPAGLVSTAVGAAASPTPTAAQAPAPAAALSIPNLITALPSIAGNLLKRVVDTIGGVISAAIVGPVAALFLGWLATGTLLIQVPLFRVVPALFMPAMILATPVVTVVGGLFLAGTWLLHQVGLVPLAASPVAATAPKPVAAGQSTQTSAEAKGRAANSPAKPHTKSGVHRPPTATGLKPAAAHKSTEPPAGAAESQPTTPPKPGRHTAPKNSTKTMDGKGNPHKG